MNTLKKAVPPLLLVAVLLCIGGAMFGSGVLEAAPVAETHYTTLREAVPSISHSAISSVETKTWTATPLDPQPTRGNPKLTARVDFSDAAATCALALGLYYKDTAGTYTFLGVVDVVTVTASSTHQVSAGGRYVSEDLPIFDTHGAPYIDLRVITISAGSVTVRPWLYGSNSKGFD
jgi:hypothetical protein